MRVISKTKLINIIVQDCRELKKVKEFLYSVELDSVIMLRVKKVYNLNYTMEQEVQLKVFDIIKNYASGLVFNLKKDLQEVLK